MPACVPPDSEGCCSGWGRKQSYDATVLLEVQYMHPFWFSQTLKMPGGRCRQAATPHSHTVVTAFEHMCCSCTTAGYADDYNKHTALHYQLFQSLLLHSCSSTTFLDRNWNSCPCSRSYHASAQSVRAAWNCAYSISISASYHTGPETVTSGLMWVALLRVVNQTNSLVPTPMNAFTLPGAHWLIPSRCHTKHGCVAFPTAAAACM